MELELLQHKNSPTPASIWNNNNNNLAAVEGVWEYVSFLVKSFHKVIF